MSTTSGDEQQDPSGGRSTDWGQVPAPGGPPPGYGQPPAPPGQPYYQPWQPTTTNGLAIASLVLGILWLYWLGSVLALVFGYVAKRQIASSGGRQQGGGMATAGIVLGWIGVGFLTLFILLGVLGAAWSAF
jgi:hypothetical protein